MTTSVDTYVVLFEHGAYKGIVGPYTPSGAKKTISYWKRGRNTKQRTAYTVRASSHDEAYSKTLGMHARENPLTTRNVLLGVAVLGAIGAVVYATVAGAAVEAVPKAVGSGTTPPLQPTPVGNQNAI
jgi:hypothetical protein